ncbi:MAG: ATP-binding cassette domain-containing protein, partial [Bacteroidales bacterium]
MAAKATNKKETREVVIDIASLKKDFGNVEVLKDVSFSLFREENLVVLGKSGSGKSVLIKCIVRLLEKDEGTISVLGENVYELNRSDLAELRKKIGFLFQSGALYDSMTIGQNLEFQISRTKKNLTKAQIEEKVALVLEQVGLADTVNQMPSGPAPREREAARGFLFDDGLVIRHSPLVRRASE